MKPLRILHVILSRGFKGSERSAVEYCNYLHANGHEVGIVICRGQGILRRSASRPCMECIEQHLAPGIQVIRVPRQLFALRALRTAAEQFAPDVIHCHLARATALVSRLRTAVPTVATLHMHNFDPAYLGVDALLCVARWQRGLIPQQYAGYVDHVPNIVRPHRKLSREERNALRAELNIAPSEYVVGGVGQLVKRKGWDILIRAFRKAALPNARLLILGEGRSRRQLLDISDERVLLPGFRANVRDYLQIMDVFVSAAREEAFGLSVLEALEAGLPVIASDANGCREILSTCPGDVFASCNVDELAGSLVKRHGLRSAPLHIDVSAYAPENAGARLVAAYTTLLQRRSPRAVASFACAFLALSFDVGGVMLAPA